MTAETAIATVTNCARCGVTTDECYASRDDCCTGCTHYPVLDPADDIDRIAVERAMNGDTTIPLNAAEHAEAYRCLAAGGLTDAAIGRTLGVRTDLVQRWRNGERDIVARRIRQENAMNLTSTTEDATDALLRRAAQSESKRIRAAAVRVTDALDRLREAFAEDEGKRAARERVAKLEEELRAAKAALKGKSAAVPRSPRPAHNGDPIPCAKGCGRTFRDRRGIGLHEKSCTGSVVTGDKAAV